MFTRKHLRFKEFELLSLACLGVCVSSEHLLPRPPILVQKKRAAQARCTGAQAQARKTYSTDRSIGCASRQVKLVSLSATEIGDCQTSYSHCWQVEYTVLNVFYKNEQELLEHPRVVINSVR